MLNDVRFALRSFTNVIGLQSGFLTFQSLCPEPGRYPSKETAKCLQVGVSASIV